MLLGPRSTPSRWRRRVVAALVAGVAVAGLTAVPALAAPPPPPPVTPRPASTALPTPAIDRNFADPDVLLVDGVYHAYATNDSGQNVQHATSRDLRSWTRQPDAAPTLGAWVGACTFDPGGPTDRCVWAPEVAEVAGGYALYYTARDAASQRQCIGVSLATSPDGPFRPVGDAPLVCPTAASGNDLGGAIDASTYRENGKLWLLWKADGNCCSLPATIFIQPLSADGATLTGPAVPLVTNDRPWEGAVVEAPDLVEHDGTYYLFYSANDFYGGGYREGYATASSPTGPFTKRATELMTTDRFAGQVRGPGGADVFTARDGSSLIAYHGWDPTYTYRALYVSALDWTPDGPAVVGASTRYQAEDGVLTNARVVADDSASGSAKVGGMDFADSAVSVAVTVPRAGTYTVGVRYANGSSDADGRGLLATDRLTVDGGRAQTVTFARTSWGNWQVVETAVKLRAGVNTVTLTRLTNFAEVDAVDVSARAPFPASVAVPAGPAVRTRYEAEAGVLTDARVRSDPTASGGAVVGGLDNPDSSVTLRVYAANARPVTLAITFANGSERGGWGITSTDRVTVGGRDAGVVTFPFTTWGNDSVVEHRVQLRPGWNDVTLTKLTFYAELDAVDVR